jgi:UDP-glucuronate 4-epimerase
MATFSFTKAICEGRPIRLFNNGDMKRDFTYVDDIVEGVIRVLDRPPSSRDGEVPYRLYNIGNREPVELLEFIGILERCLGKKAITTLETMQPGDVQHTFADVSDLERDTGFRPETPVETGVARFVEWYRDYYELPIVVRSKQAS